MIITLNLREFPQLAHLNSLQKVSLELEGQVLMRLSGNEEEIKFQVNQVEVEESPTPPNPRDILMESFLSRIEDKQTFAG